MTALLYLLGVVFFVLLLNLSIALHECGHMLPARKFGVRVPQFSVGLGRKLWSKQRGETEFVIRAIPLMGWVKLVGMLPPDGKERGGPFGRLVSDARAVEAQHLRPGDENRVFYRLPPWKKIIVMAGGPTVNLVIAFVIFAGVFGLKGVAQPTLTVDTVSDCVKVVRADQPAGKCTAADQVAPARAAGIHRGDVVVSFNGARVASYYDLQRRIRANEAGAATVVVERGGKQVTLHTNTAINSLPSDSGSNPSASVRAGFLGITPTETIVHEGPGYTLQQMGGFTKDTIVTIGQLPSKLYHVALAVVGVEKRDSASPMSVVGISRVAGGVASDQQVSFGDRLITLLMILAGVNLFLGVFNFLPLLPLDGGHIAGAMYEALRRAFARLFRRPDPGYFDVARLLPVAYVVMGAFVLMTVLLVVADIVAPVTV